VTTLQVSNIGGPITVLGPGTRVVLWVQGCTIGCFGCASTDTWASDGGSARSVRDVADELLDTAARIGATGLTISGGEPFQQAAALSELLTIMRTEWSNGDLDILVFTGYAAAAARRRSAELWASADIIVAGPYRAARRSEHPLLGSDNQTIEILTALGEHRMGEVSGRPRPLQVAMQGGKLVVVGMPDPGDLDRLRTVLAQRGVQLDDVSWDNRGSSLEA
jgi:anaerobic ribonucleoside-triphosphate reductase activating protein